MTFLCVGWVHGKVTGRTRCFHQSPFQTVPTTVVLAVLTHPLLTLLNKLWRWTRSGGVLVQHAACLVAERSYAKSHHG